MINDTEYAQKFVTARTNWTGNEIVGAWVSKLHMPGTFVSSRITLLLRPDGTGRAIDKCDALNLSRREYIVSWHYSGSGVWSGTGKVVSGMALRGFLVSSTDFTLALRYSGNELLADFRSTYTNTNCVFVRSDNEEAVEEHLKKR